MWHETRIQGSGKECNCQQDAMNEAALSRSFWEAIRALLGFKACYFEWMCFYLKPEYTHCNVKEKRHKGTLMTAAPTFFKVCDPFIPYYTLWKKKYCGFWYSAIWTPEFSVKLSNTLKVHYSWTDSMRVTCLIFSWMMKCTIDNIQETKAGQ